MKNKFGMAVLAGLMVLVLGLAVGQAQVTPPSPNITVVACTNNVPNSGTTTANLGAVIDLTRYKDVGLQMTYKLNGAGTTACTFNWARSADGTNFNTTAPISFAFAPNGTTFVSTNANVTVGALPYIKLLSIVAANNSADMTNITVIAVTKPGPKD
jgi:hypothetical protein